MLGLFKKIHKAFLNGTQVIIIWKINIKVWLKNQEDK